MLVAETNRNERKVVVGSLSINAYLWSRVKLEFQLKLKLRLRLGGSF